MRKRSRAPAGRIWAESWSRSGYDEQHRIRALAERFAPVRTRGIVFLWVGAISFALTGVVGCHNSEPAAAQPNPAPATAQPAAPGQEKGGRAALDGSAVCSRLAVLTVGKESAARRGRRTRAARRSACIPEFSQPSRPDMLPRNGPAGCARRGPRRAGPAMRDEGIDEHPEDARTPAPTASK